MRDDYQDTKLPQSHSHSKSSKRDQDVIGGVFFSISLQINLGTWQLLMIDMGELNHIMLLYEQQHSFMGE